MKGEVIKCKGNRKERKNGKGEANKEVLEMDDEVPKGDMEI